MSPAISEKLQNLAKDLTREAPRSPRGTLAGYVIAGRTLDRCRALLNETLGDYFYNQFMDRQFFGFTGIDAKAFKEYVATGASDEEVAAWITANAEPRTAEEIAQWNELLCSRKLSDLPSTVQTYLRDYIAEHLPVDRQNVVYVFDIFDIEEGRL